MKRTFTASISREDGWVVAQCLEIGIASQGRTEPDVVVNLQEALERYFEPPVATVQPMIVPLEIEIEFGAA